MAKDNAAAAAKDEDQYGDVAFSLSDQERAAIADDPDSVAGDDDDGKGGPPSSDKADDKAAGDGSDPKAGKAEGDAEDEVPRGTASTVQLRPTRQIDPKVAERVTAIDAELDALDAKWENDEISQKEYARLSRALQEEKADKKADLRELEFVRGANQQYLEQDWNKSVATFLNDNPEFKDDAMRDVLDGRLKALYADEKNIGASHQWFLETARRDATARIRKALGGELPAGAGNTDLDAPPSTKEQVKQQAAAAAKAKGALPKTLGDVPASSESDVGQDPYAKLESLEGLELERALAQMDENQADKYLRAGK